MSPSEAFEILKNWQVARTVLKLTTKRKQTDPAAMGREEITDYNATIESLEGERLRLSFNGKTEELDLTGATFASLPGVLQITLREGNKLIALSDRKR